MKVASRPPLRRILTLDETIRAGHFPNCLSLSAQMEVHRRTILRDLDFMRESLGVPLEFCRKHNGYYYSNPDYALPLFRLTEGELVALFLAERLLQAFRGTPHASALASIFRKLTVALPEEVTIDLNHLDEIYSFHQPGINVADAKRLQQLAHAARERRQLELVYWTASRDDTCKRVVDPYHLMSVHGDWYLVGYCHLREDVRMFVPSRIRSLKETGERFNRPADFRIADYMDASFRVMHGDGPPQRVRVRFTPEAARYVRERVWHPSQKVQELKAGGLALTMKVNHLLEVKRWVLSYGAGCEVLEPEELRREVAEEVRRVADLYGSDER